MIRDRGRIKWTSMMLPEHVKFLRNWAKEDSWETEKPLDEQMLEQLDVVLQEVQELKKMISVEYYEDHHYHTARGRIRKIDPLAKEIQVKDETTGAIKTIEITHIHHLEWVE